MASATAAPIPRGSVTAGMASATAAPAAAAVSVRPCGSTGVRLKQASAPAGLAASSNEKGKGRGCPVAAATRASATAGPPRHRANWEQAGYRHPKEHTILIPDDGAKFHHGVPQCVRANVASGRAYDGARMDRKYIKDLEFAIGKCIRHSTILPMSPAGFRHLTDVPWVLCPDPQRYYGLTRRPTEAECMYAVECSKVGRFQVSSLNQN